MCDRLAHPKPEHQKCCIEVDTSSGGLMIVGFVNLPLPQPNVHFHFVCWRAMVIILLLFLFFIETCGQSLSKGTLFNKKSDLFQRVAESQALYLQANPRPYEGVAETVYNLLERRGLRAERPIINLFSVLLESPVQEKTMRRLLNGMTGEFPVEQQEQFKGVVHKMNGLHKKRERLMGTLAHMLNYTDPQIQLMKRNLSYMKITEIMDKIEDEAKWNATLSNKIQNLRRNMKGWGKRLKTE